MEHNFYLHDGYSKLETYVGTLEREYRCWVVTWEEEEEQQQQKR